MTLDLDRLLLFLGKKIPFLKLDSYEEQLQALIHITSSSWWACGFAHLCRKSYLWFLTAVLWIVYVLYRELIADGHVKRMLKKTETNDQKRDFVSDLFTKLIGLIFYGLAFL